MIEVKSRRSEEASGGRRSAAGSRHRHREKVKARLELFPSRNWQFISNLCAVHASRWIAERLKMGTWMHINHRLYWSRLTSSATSGVGWKSAERRVPALLIGRSFQQSHHVEEQPGNRRNSVVVGIVLRRGSGFQIECSPWLALRSRCLGN